MDEDDARRSAVGRRKHIPFLPRQGTVGDIEARRVRGAKSGGRGLAPLPQFGHVGNGGGAVVGGVALDLGQLSPVHATISTGGTSALSAAKRRPWRSANTGEIMVDAIIASPELSRRTNRPGVSRSTEMSRRAPDRERPQAVRQAEHGGGVAGDAGDDLGQRHPEREQLGHRMGEVERRHAMERAGAPRPVIRVSIGSVAAENGHVVTVHVGAEREGPDAGGERPPRHGKAEMRAVADIDDDAAIEPGPDDRTDLAGAGRHEAAGMARERVGQNVAFVHQRHEFRDQRVRVLAPACPRSARAGPDGCTAAVRPPARCAWRA